MAVCGTVENAHTRQGNDKTKVQRGAMSNLRPLSLSDLTLMIFNVRLTHLDSEASKYLPQNLQEINTHKDTKYKIKIK